MADTSQYTDSVGLINSEQFVTWKPIGDLVRAIVEKQAATKK